MELAAIDAECRVFGLDGPCRRLDDRTLTHRAEFLIDRRHHGGELRGGQLGDQRKEIRPGRQLRQVKAAALRKRCRLGRVAHHLLDARHHQPRLAHQRVQAAQFGAIAATQHVDGLLASAGYSCT